ncbi:hypothetical protein C8Q70DRAFT_96591 [Cubamyces menziesii]|nr:hypothetical protein C8Q70DRAFT_96591 [Cubamyces menziesii]
MSWWRLRCGPGDSTNKREGGGALVVIRGNELTVCQDTSALFSQCAMRRNGVYSLVTAALSSRARRAVCGLGRATMGAIVLCTARSMRCILPDVRRASIRKCAPRTAHHGKLRKRRVAGRTYLLRTRRLRSPIRSVPSSPRVSGKSFTGILTDSDTTSWREVEPRRVDENANAEIDCSAHIALQERATPMPRSLCGSFAEPCLAGKDAQPPRRDVRGDQEASDLESEALSALSGASFFVSVPSGEP